MGNVYLETELQQRLDSAMEREKERLQQARHRRNVAAVVDFTSNLLSRGTSDLSYIALRISIAKELFGTESPIMVFDESFAHIDRARTEAAFRLLGGNQYVILTCRSDDTEAAAKIGANVINL